MNCPRFTQILDYLRNVKKKLLVLVKSARARVVSLRAAKAGGQVAVLVIAFSNLSLINIIKTEVGGEGWVEKVCSIRTAVWPRGRRGGGEKERIVTAN